MRSFGLLTSIEQILKPNCSISYLHSNDMNSSKSLLEEKRAKATNIIVIKNHK